MIHTYKIQRHFQKVNSRLYSYFVAWWNNLSAGSSILFIIYYIIDEGCRHKQSDNHLTNAPAPHVLYFCSNHYLLGNTADDNLTHTQKSNNAKAYSSFFWGLECSKACKCGITNGLEVERKSKLRYPISKLMAILLQPMTKIIMTLANNSLDDLLVYKPRSHKLGMIKPHEESTLDNVIERNPAHHKRSDALRDGKTRKDNPISQPLSIIGGITRIDSFEWHVSGVDECENIGEEFGSTNGHDEWCDEWDNGEEEVGLFLPSLLLEVTETVCRRSPINNLIWIHKERELVFV